MELRAQISDTFDTNRSLLGIAWMLEIWFLKNIFIGVLLLYNVVLLSAVLQSESAICLHISLLFLDFPLV